MKHSDFSYPPLGDVDSTREHYISFNSEVRVTPKELGEMFAKFDDEQQAEFLMGIAKSKNEGGSKLYQSLARAVFLGVEALEGRRQLGRFEVVFRRCFGDVRWKLIGKKSRLELALSSSI